MKKAAVLVVLLAVGWYGVRVVSVSRLLDARYAWEAKFGSWDDHVARNPARSSDSAAHRIEALAADLGIDLVPKGEESANRPSETDAEAFKALYSELGSFLRQNLESGNGAVAEPPSSITAYLAGHSVQLDALRHALLTGETPQWLRHVDPKNSFQLPNLLGHVKLHGLLLVDALARARVGDHDRAEADLEASFRLNASLVDSPVLLEQLIVLDVARMQIGAMRHLGGSSNWSGQLAQYDNMMDLVEQALIADVGFYLHVHAGHLTGPNTSRVVKGLSQPYVRMSLAAYSDRLLPAFEELETRTDRCLPMTSDTFMAAVESAPDWDWFGGYSPSNYDNVLDRVSRFELDLELTRKVLELKSSRAESGSWPGDAEAMASSSCTNGHWLYDVSSDEGASLTFSESPEWPNAIGLILPMTYTAKGPGGGVAH